MGSHVFLLRTKISVYRGGHNAPFWSVLCTPTSSRIQLLWRRLLSTAVGIPGLWWVHLCRLLPLLQSLPLPADPLRDHDVALLREMHIVAVSEFLQCCGFVAELVLCWSECVEDVNDFLRRGFPWWCSAVMCALLVRWCYVLVFLCWVHVTDFRSRRQTRTGGEGGRIKIFSWSLTDSRTVFRDVTCSSRNSSGVATVLARSLKAQIECFKQKNS